MNITPRWQKAKPGDTPIGLPLPSPQTNLSDVENTQPSDRLIRSTSPRAPNDTENEIRNESYTVDVKPIPNSAADPLVGIIFADRYEVIELLGRGGMGSVYKVRNRINKNLRALKLMHAHLVADPQVFRRFQQEAKAAARINHRNAITIIDMGVAADGRPYLIMDFLDGMSLSELLKYKRKLSIKEALLIFTQMCGALTEAHSHGVIHRDIKPSNVMLLDCDNSDDYLVKVVDFGIAKVFPQEGDPTMKDTTTGELFGSPPYMSPEQCLGKRLDYRSDIYSMGCLMYECLTGAPPLVGQNALGTMYKQINDLPTPLTHLGEDVRLIQRVDEIISKTLQKDPNNRYQSIQDLQHDLESVNNISAKKSRIISSSVLKLQDFNHAVMNKMGSSRKSVGTLVITCVSTLSIAGTIVASYLQNRDPVGTERFIAWEKPRTFEISKNLLIAQESIINEAKLVHGVLSQPVLEATSELASTLLEGEKTAKALDQLDEACAVGEGLLKNEFSSCGKPDLAINLFAIDQLQRVICLNSSANTSLQNFSSTNGLQPPSEPAILARDTLRLLKKREITNPETYAALESTIAFSAMKNAQAGDQAAKDEVDKNFQLALINLDNVVPAHHHVALFASTLSQITDYYLNSNQPKDLLKADHACKLASTRWRYLNDKGGSNYAVSEERLGHIQQLLGDTKSAISFYRNAAVDLEISNDEETLGEAKALFDEADARWISGDYLRAIQVHSTAVKIWTKKRVSS